MQICTRANKFRDSLHPSMLHSTLRPIVLTKGVALCGYNTGTMCTEAAKTYWSTRSRILQSNRHDKWVIGRRNGREHSALSFLQRAKRAISLSLFSHGVPNLDTPPKVRPVCPAVPVNREHLITGSRQGTSLSVTDQPECTVDCSNSISADGPANLM